MAEDQVVDNARILESKETSSDLNSDETIREMTIEFTDEDGFVDPRDLARRQHQLYLQRTESNPLHMEDLIDLSSLAEGSETDHSQVEKSNNMELYKSTTQVMESLRNNWDITKTLLTNQEQRVRRLEEGGGGREFYHIDQLG